KACWLNSQLSCPLGRGPSQGEHCQQGVVEHMWKVELKMIVNSDVGMRHWTSKQEDPQHGHLDVPHVIDEFSKPDIVVMNGLSFVFSEMFKQCTDPFLQEKGQSRLEVVLDLDGVLIPFLQQVVPELSPFEIVLHQLTSRNQANKSAGLKEANNSAGTEAYNAQGANSEEINLHDEHFVLPIWFTYSTTVKSSCTKIEKTTNYKTCEKPNANTNSTNLLNAVSTPISTAGPSIALNNGEPSSPSSTTIDQDAPSPSNSQTSPKTQSPVISNDVEEENHDLDVAHMNNDLFFGISILKNAKDHPLDNIIGKLRRPVSTRLQLHEQALFCYSDAFLSSVKLKTYKDALTQACWIEAMQEELNEFERLDVWELVSHPDKVMVITLKWIYKVKLDELGGNLKNKAQLVTREYELAARLQEEEQGELTIEEKSRLFVELIDKRKKHFAKLKAEEQKRKPPTKAQKRNKMLVKDKAVLTQESSSKIAGDKLDQRRSKKQKVKDDKVQEELKRCLEIIPDDEDDVTIDATPLSIKTQIIDYKIYKERKKSYF
nr:hypothetical protein [Tanacetum cinerariifolium]